MITKKDIDESLLKMPDGYEEWFDKQILERYDVSEYTKTNGFYVSNPPNWDSKYKQAVINFYSKGGWNVTWENGDYQSVGGFKFR